jgi:uncharacterized protein (TIGR03067 family)
MIQKLSIVLFAVMLFAFSSSSVLAKDADEAIQGTWQASTAELGGQKYPDQIVKTIKLLVQGDIYLVTVGTQRDSGTLKLDVKAKPKAIDITGTEGPNKGKLIPAIYEMNGDILRICYDLSGNSRPASFKTEAGTQLFLVTYQREKRIVLVAPALR